MTTPGLPRRSRPPLTVAILGDTHFWVPVVVLGFGLAVLVWLS